MHKVALGMIGGGAIALSLSLVLGWLGIPHIMRSQIKKASRLQRGVGVYEFWKESGFPVYMKFYLYNVNNPDEVIAGAKPQITELGPFTYLEKLKKVDIVEGTKNFSITYRQIRTLYFRPDMSNGKEEDELTYLNIPFVNMAKLTDDYTEDELAHSMLDETLTSAGETLFKKATVKDILFDGVSVEAYLDLIEQAKIVNKDAKVPKAFMDGKFALYKGRNGSDDGTFEVKTGLKDFREYGQIMHWNNLTKLPWWKEGGEGNCNEINGTDGSVYVPFLRRDRVLRSYNPDMCRTVDLVYDRDEKLRDIPLLRFTYSKSAFKGKHENVNNTCFCTEKEESICEKTGLLVMSGCQEQAPTLISTPHFFGAQEDLINAVEGISPNETMHKSYFDMEPISSAILRAARRTQFNVELKPHPKMPSFANVPKVVFPIMWMEESFEYPEESMNFYFKLYMILEIIDYGKWVMVIASLGCLLLGAICGALRKDSIDPELLKR